MIVKPTVTELLEKTENRYELVIATSKRARQIAMGDERLTDSNEESPVTLAAIEISEGKVRVEKEGQEHVIEIPEEVKEDVEEEKVEEKSEEVVEIEDKAETKEKKKTTKTTKKDK